MGNNIARQITDRLKLRDVMEYYGVKFDRRGFAKCPFHTEKTASLSIKNEHYKCFGCGAYGGIIDFVMNYFGIGFKQALAKLNIDFNLGLGNQNVGYRKRSEVAEQQRIQRNIEKWEAELHSEYMTLCLVYELLYRRSLNGESWLLPFLNQLEVILDTFNDEEARMWEMIIR